MIPLRVVLDGSPRLRNVGCETAGTTCTTVAAFSRSPTEITSRCLPPTSRFTRRTILPRLLQNLIRTVFCQLQPGNFTALPRGDPERSFAACFFSFRHPNVVITLRVKISRHFPRLRISCLSDPGGNRQRGGDGHGVRASLRRPPSVSLQPKVHCQHQRVFFGRSAARRNSALFAQRLRHAAAGPTRPASVLHVQVSAVVAPFRLACESQSALFQTQRERGRKRQINCLKR